MPKKSRHLDRNFWTTGTDGANENFDLERWLAYLAEVSSRLRLDDKEGEDEDDEDEDEDTCLGGLEDDTIKGDDAHPALVEASVKV